MNRSRFWVRWNGAWSRLTLSEGQSLTVRQGERTMKVQADENTITMFMDAPGHCWYALCSVHETDEVDGFWFDERSCWLPLWCGVQVIGEGEKYAW